MRLPETPDNAQLCGIYELGIQSTATLTCFIGQKNEMVSWALLSLSGGEKAGHHPLPPEPYFERDVKLSSIYFSYKDDSLLNFFYSTFFAFIELLSDINSRLIQLNVS